MQIKRCGFSPIGWKRRQVLCGSEKKINSIGDLQMVLQFFILPKGDLQMKKKCLQVVSQLNYSQLRSFCCPSFRSTAERRVTTPFTAFSSISCVMSDTFWWMTSFSAASDAGQSRCTFDFKNPLNQKSQSVRQGDLRGHESVKVSTNNAILPKC